MSKSAVYHKNSFIGEVDVYYKNSTNRIRDIRISHFSQSSERCCPLAILHTIANDGVCFKLESKLPSQELFACYSTCLRENKTAVVALADEELHLVALSSRKNLMQYSCFWGFRVSPGLYNSCLVMLNLRCLGIVFDLDETLIVANTMRSFEDRINTLQQKISVESDPQRVAGMIAEIKRYQEDKYILKQYLENDQVIDNGVVYKAQSEVIQPVSDNHQLISRPIIRLQEKNIILTRVNPTIRDTSVLVRLRPAWEDLRSYLTARGRKRFEVYVCTMAERDYALEMWRLLDPQSNLISPVEIMDRIVCVKPGTKKSLLNVFQGGVCDPKMALVIDDRLKVWEDSDQPRVHVVPAFAPYYAPQAEANNPIPVLCVARNVACNVRGSFFKEFDDDLLPRFTNIFYEDEMIDLPYAPDVGNYLISEDDASGPNGSKDPIVLEGMADGEVEGRLKGAILSAQSYPHVMNNEYDLRSMPSSLPHIMSSLPQVIMPLSGSIAEEGEVHETDIDPNTRRRLLILQHGQDNVRSSPPPLPPPPPPLPSFPFGPPSIQVPVPSGQPRTNWLPLEEEMMPPRQPIKPHKEFALEAEAMNYDRKRSNRSSFGRDRFHHENQRPPPPPEVHYGEFQARRTRPTSNFNSFPGEGTPVSKFSSSQRDARSESRPTTAQYGDNKLEALQEIARDSEGGKVTFRTDVCDTSELQFIVEAWFVGDKVGKGIGITRKEAQHLAVMEALETLSNTYIAPNTTDMQKRSSKFSHSQENGASNSITVKHATEESTSPAAMLKELCITEGYTVSFLAQTSSPAGGSINEEDIQHFALVEIAGQVMGNGSGKTWEEAKMKAAEEALESLKSMLGQFTHKRPISPRSQVATSHKRPKQDLSRAMQIIPSSGR